MVSGRPALDRSAWLVLTAIALLAASCTSGGSEGEEAESGPTAPEQVAGDAPVPEAVSVWMPSSLALDTFVDSAVAAADFEVSVVEEPASYEQTEAAAELALEAGDLVMVPSTIGARLINTGRAAFVGRIFEDEDPEVAFTQLGVWFVESPDHSRSRLAPAASARRFQSESNRSEVVSLAKAEAEALSDSALQTTGFEAASRTVEALAQKYGARVGGSVGARTIAKAAGPVGAVLDFSYTMYQFEEAASEMFAAEASARTAAYDTGLQAVAMTSSARTKLCLLEAPFLSGEIEPQDAKLLIESLSISVDRAGNVAEASANDLEGLDAESDAAQIRQLQEAREAAFEQKKAELLAEVEATIAAGDTSVFSPSVGTIQRITGTTVSPDEWEQRLSKAFLPVETGNESTHSDGSQTVRSAGEVDITEVGQFWWKPSSDGPSLDELMPCDDPGTFCGSRSYDGTYTVATAVFDEPLTLDPSRYYQYAFVFDRDGTPAGNYEASDSFPSDTWDQSDLRYEFTSSPSGDRFSVTEGVGFDPLETDATI